MLQHLAMTKGEKVRSKFGENFLFLNCDQGGNKNISRRLYACRVSELASLPQESKDKIGNVKSKGTW